MRVAVVYNAKNSNVLNVFGLQNKEWYPEQTIDLVSNALETGGHTVKIIEADRHLLSKLDDFLPKLSKGNEPGIVFNLALGIQGKCRYTHVPAILEMSGIPYSGSSPLGHALALDKVIAKQIFVSLGLPTPKFVVFDDISKLEHTLKYPLVVKPRSEAASFGIQIVQNKNSLKKAVASVLENYRQPALVEEFIEGREVNVSIIGNNPPQTFPILELITGDSNLDIFTYDDKFHRSGREIKRMCPANIPKDLMVYIQKIALQAYRALNIYDHARVDIRLDKNGNPFLLEINSMVSINPTSSFVYTAKVVGIDYNHLINKILDCAVERYAMEEPKIFRCLSN